MIEKIIKRDGRVVDYDNVKIFNAVMLAVHQVKEKGIYVDNPIELAQEVADNVENHLESIFDEEGVNPTVEQIQDLVVAELRELNKDVSKHYEKYRKTRTKERIRNSAFMKEQKNISKTTHRENANVGNNFSAKLLQKASSANKLANILDMPEDIAEAHEIGDIHIHDLDSYDLTINCLNIPTAEVLRGGFNTGYGHLREPQSITSAAALACIVMQSSQNDMFGGQTHVDFDNDMAEYVEKTEKRIIAELNNALGMVDGTIDAAQYDEFIEKKLEKEVRQAMQITVCNLNSMHSRAGSQVPFSSINLGVPKNKYAALVCQLFLEEFNKGLGKGEMPIFPNVIFRLKKGVNANPEDPYYYLRELAEKVSANRMNPTFLNLDATFNKELYDSGILSATMGCRTRIGGNINGTPGPSKRGNVFPVSINLPRLAIQATMASNSEHNTENKFNIFKSKLQDVLELCERQIMHRYNVCKELKGKDLPFVIGQKLIMGAEEVGPEDSIEPVMKHGTYGIGFIGLAETLKLLFGAHHGEREDMEELGLSIIQIIRDYCDKMTKKYSLNFTCYATPAEGLSGRFVAIDREMFGEIPGITDKDYYTNSFHIPVSYNISALEKARLEAPFHSICNAGHISYFELDTPPKDATFINRVNDYIINETDMGYWGFNYREKYCKECGQNHIQGKACPKCGSTDLQGVSRVTGYLSLDERFSKGKIAEREDRVSHSL